MLQRNVDFFAVLVIAAALFAFSKISSWQPGGALDTIRIGNAIHVEYCPLPESILSRLAYILNQ